MLSRAAKRATGTKLAGPLIAQRECRFAALFADRRPLVSKKIKLLEKATLIENFSTADKITEHFRNRQVASDSKNYFRLFVEKLHLSPADGVHPDVMKKSVEAEIFAQSRGEASRRHQTRRHIDRAARMPLRGAPRRQMTVGEQNN